MRDKFIVYSILLLIDDVKEKFCEVRDGSKEKSNDVFRPGFREVEDGAHVSSFDMPKVMSSGGKCGTLF